MPLSPETIELQRRLAKSCREGEAGVYPRLIRKVFEDTLSSAYPIARCYLGAGIWDEMLSAFVAGWPCRSPELWRMPSELLEWERGCGFGHARGFDFLGDLLELEWAEIEVFMAPRQDLVYPAGTIALSPASRLSEMRYPVFKLPQAELAAARGRYFLLTYRCARSGAVEYMELSAGIFSACAELRKSPRCRAAISLELPLLEPALASLIEAGALVEGCGS